MTEVNTNPPIGAAQAASTLPGPDNSPPAIASDFETFLVMLTAQIQNQDPLNPMESTEFATQLATFSAVEQQVRTNTLLERLSRDLVGADLGQVADMIGREVRAAAPAWFDGSAIDVFTDVPANADAAQLVVTDETGEEVQRFELRAGEDRVTWDGLGPGDSTMPWGYYSFVVVSEVDGQPLPSRVAEVFATVEEAQMENGAPVLLLSGGARLPAAQVSALR